MPELLVKITRDNKDKILATIKNQMKYIVYKTAQLMVAEAKANAPVVSGFLKNGISVTFKNELHAVVRSVAYYSGFVEFGTATRVASDAPPGYTVSRAAYDIHTVNAKSLHFISKDGRDVFVNAVYGHPGIYPHPFFMPAVDAARKLFESEVKTLRERLK